MDEKMALKSILAKRLITTVFQPVIHIATERVVGYEALSRGPDGPLQYPYKFLTVAARYGYSLEIEQLCLKRAKEFISTMPPELKVFVNLSPDALEKKLISDGDFDQYLTVIEITEAGLIKDYARIKKAVDHYRSCGFRVAMDDVGNGYDRLRGIAEINPDYFKIDRGLIADCHLNGGKRMVIKHLVALAAEMKARVIAEGIEKPEELNAIRILGVHFGQGFLLGKPQSKPWESLIPVDEGTRLQLNSRC